VFSIHRSMLPLRDCREAELSCAGPYGCAGEGGAVKGEALCARAAGAARPLTARSPALGNGHTREACDTGCACKRADCTMRPVFWGTVPARLLSALSGFDGLDEFVDPLVSMKA